MRLRVRVWTPSGRGCLPSSLGTDTVRLGLYALPFRGIPVSLSACHHPWILPVGSDRRGPRLCVARFLFAVFLWLVESSLSAADRMLDRRELCGQPGSLHAAE